MPGKPLEKEPIFLAKRARAGRLTPIEDSHIRGPDQWIPEHHQGAGLRAAQEQFRVKGGRWS